MCVFSTSLARLWRKFVVVPSQKAPRHESLDSAKSYGTMHVDVQASNSFNFRLNSRFLRLVLYNRPKREHKTVNSIPLLVHKSPSLSCNCQIYFICEQDSFVAVKPAEKMKIECGAVVLLLCLLHCCSLSAAQLNGTLPNCSFPAVYAFGDSLTDVGNAIAAFPEQFSNSEADPYGVQFPSHPADRFSDGKLFIDFLAFGVRRRPIYAVLRGTGADFTYGTNFAVSGSTARNVTYWSKNGGFYTPFSLDVQAQWKKRYQERLWFYENMNPGIVQQSLPFLNATGKSLYLVYAGYQDYFMSLYDNTLTPQEALTIVPDVVKGIENLIEKLVTVQSFYPPTHVLTSFPAAENILVANLPPLGCIPAMLTQFQNPNATYDTYGCLSDLNAITAAHNQYLLETVIALRAKYPTVKIYHGDTTGVYTDILKDPVKYNVTQPLKACCGVGGSYNFNKEVWCSYTGPVGNELVNLTAAPCANRAAHLSWDGIHPSNTFNKAAATAFFSGEHITPTGGFNCFPEYVNFDARF